MESLAVTCMECQDLYSVIILKTHYDIEEKSMSVHYWINSFKYISKLFENKNAAVHVARIVAGLSIDISWLKYLDMAVLKIKSVEIFCLMTLHTGC